ncbi:MAG TPA: hypothetical protein VLJ83_03290, partial [Gemmatimonadaceae bacterium]|nr:hypothetical protein [Gemmatimonadaceae bacterium]
LYQVDRIGKIVHCHIALGHRQPPILGNHLIGGLFALSLCKFCLHPPSRIRVGGSKKMTRVRQFMRDGIAHVFDIVIRDSFESDKASGRILARVKFETALAWNPVDNGTESPQSLLEKLNGIGPDLNYAGEHEVDVLAPCQTVVSNGAQDAVMIVDWHVYETSESGALARVVGLGSMRPPYVGIGAQRQRTVHTSKLQLVRRTGKPR